MEHDLALAAQLQAELDGERRKTVQSGSSAAAASSSNARPGPPKVKCNDPRDDLMQHVAFLQGSSLICEKCEARVHRKQGKTSFNNVGGDPKSEILKQCHIVCGKCFTLLCAGCGEESECERDCESEHSNGCPTAAHCAQIRAILMYEALAAFDRLYIELKRPLSTAHPTKKAKAGQGVGYGRGYGKELGKSVDADVLMDDEDRTLDRAESSAKADAVDAFQSFALKVDAKIDSLLATALDTIFVLTPRPLDDDEAETYDYVPHKSLLPLLQLSCLPETLSELLRNDSIGSVSERVKVYTVALELLQRFAACALLIPLMIESRRVKALTDGIGALVAGSGSFEWEYEQGKNRVKDVMVAEPLYSQMKRLVKQAQTYIRITQSAQKPEEPDTTVPPLPVDEEAEKAAHEQVRLAERVVAMAASTESAILEQGIDLPGTAGLSVQGRARSPAIEELTYSRMHETLAFDMVEDLVPQATKSLGQGQSLAMTAANANHLNKELSQLASTLPAGIYIRVDESSINEMRALIAGPEDTPYAYGLYEFSFKLPWDYPARSPTVKILTTANGRVRFNPNLYAEGKVCLSLLGTWQGAAHEQWQPWKSTLAQILISIQSMILVEEPYWNEPGMNGSDTDVLNYNKNVCLQSVRWAMIDWLDGTHLRGLWGGVIRNHFTIRRAAIRAKLQQWSTQDQRMLRWDTQTLRCCGLQPPVLEGGSSARGDKMNLVEEFENRMDKMAASS